MKSYEVYLVQKGCEVEYVESPNERSDIRILIRSLIESGIRKISLIHPTDNWLEKRISSFSNEIELEIFENSMFLNSRQDLSNFFRNDLQKFSHNSFYIQERKSKGILLDSDKKPIGGKWSFDSQNRKKYPKSKTPPLIHWPKETKQHREAKEYVEKQFSQNPGNIESIYYPIDYESANEWFEQFLDFRFYEFGDYEDAILKNYSVLNHGVLSPLLNTGLLSPNYVLNKAIKFAEKNKIPINTLEGFVRQIVGWREFIRGVYEVKGTEERTRNFWGFNRKIPESFYIGETGIPPVDDTIKKVLKTGYCHHIERLMILGNFMLLCEFDPDEVYRWFMELFIDSYDWVMVPNVYGMSQFADGGVMSTKPYISGSNYIMKMSDYSKGTWQNTWDGLFWRFMYVNRDFFLKNPRLGMLIRTFDKMSDEKRNSHISNAEHYLNHL